MAPEVTPWDRILAPATKTIVIASVLVGLTLAVILVGSKSNHAAVAIMGGRIFNLEIVDTPRLMARGLAGRTSIPKNGGMLFLFSKPGQHSFWMKDMLIPIDILWVRNNVFVFILENVKPPVAGLADEELNRFVPPEEADSVIEIAAGTAKELGLRAGQPVRILLPYK